MVSGELGASAKFVGYNARIVVDVRNIISDRHNRSVLNQTLDITNNRFRLSGADRPPELLDTLLAAAS